MKSTIGIDVIEVKRIEDIITENKEIFNKKVFTQNEVDYCEKAKAHKFESYAARFAGKEAVYKALSIENNDNINWTNIEILNKDNGRPFVILNGELQKYNELIDNIDISISHIKEIATASVVINWR